jgi:hypothetical protein
MSVQVERGGVETGGAGWLGGRVGVDGGALSDGTLADDTGGALDGPPAVVTIGVVCGSAAGLEEDVHAVTVTPSRTSSAPA